MEVGELLEVYIFGIVIILILIPILYFIPIGMNFKEKLLIAVTSFLLAEIGLFVIQYLSIWKTMLILVLLAVIVTYFVETRIRPKLADKKVPNNISSKNSWNSPDSENSMAESIDEPVDEINDSDMGDYDLGQEAIDRLLADMKKAKTDQKDTSLNPSSDDSQILHNDDYIESAQKTVLIKEDHDDIEEEKEIQETLEDPLQITQSIDVDLEIDFEKQIQASTVDDKISEVKSGPEDDLLLLRSQLFEHLNELEDSDKNEELDKMKPIPQDVNEKQNIDSIENLLEELDELEPFEQTEEEQKVGVVEDIIEELDGIEPIQQENEEINESSLELPTEEIEMPHQQLDTVDKLEDVLQEENEHQALEDHHKIMDDLEDITTSEMMQNDDTIVEEFLEQQREVSEIAVEDISPTRSEIQRQMLQTMVSQINIIKSSLTSEEYEDLVRAHMQPSLPNLEYYTFAYMLIEHYITQGQHEKLTLLIKELYDKFDMYPVIKQQLDYLIEKYKKN